MTSPVTTAVAYHLPIAVNMYNIIHSRLTLSTSKLLPNTTITVFVNLPICALVQLRIASTVLYMSSEEARPGTGACGMPRILSYPHLASSLV